MNSDSYFAIYDFALMPYALGDVLTWNVHSAIRCEALGRKKVDIFICLDERFPSNLYQREFATAENSGLLFNELFGAFGTQPKLGNLFFYRQREEMLARLRELAGNDPALAAPVDDYERTVAAREDSDALNRYFIRNAYSHEAINAFYREQGRIPLLRPSMGCEPDVAGLVTRRFAGKKIVAVHMRLRRLDIGYGGEHSYSRDSDFAEWLEFLREAARKHPEVQFVAMGRRQEKPLEMLQLPNVTCLRAWGLGLGHELTLLRQSDLFIGASSGFAAMAYFSPAPYFITRMTEGACKAYDLDFGVKRFPFGSERQILVYEPETKDLLMGLLERGLAGTPPRGGVSGTLDKAIDVKSWEWERATWLFPSATTYRFFDNADFADKETAFLLWPRIKEAQAAWREGSADRAWAILERIEANFPRLCAKFPEFLRLRLELASKRNDLQAIETCQAKLAELAARERGLPGLARAVRRFVARGFPAAMRFKYLWKRKHRIPVKLAQFIRQVASR